MTEEINYTVYVTDNAKKDLQEIIAYISQNNPQNALKILQKIETKINTLNHFPHRGGYVPELLKKNILDYRQLTESPWRIIYKVDENTVNVLLIIDSRRNLQDILTLKLMNGLRI